MKLFCLRRGLFCLAFLVLKTSAAVLYVDVTGTNPVSPYADWSNAATNIQDAVDAASAGDLILVTNGIYQTGGRVVYGALTNRVAISKAVTVQSINGPAVTVIQGYQDPGTISGDDAVRCVYLTNGATLAGFTLTNGATRSDGDAIQEQSGGGLWCESTSASVADCVLTGNAAVSSGGGAYSGTFTNCIFTTNSASGGAGGGVESGTLYGCALTGNSAANGGAADSGTLNGCTITGNTAGNAGGGLNVCLATNCALAGNVSANGGGGAEGGTLNNCTLTGNSANQGSGAEGSTLSFCTLSNNLAYNYGGGANGGELDNCSLVGNSSANSGGGVYAGTLNNCIISSNASANGGGVESCVLSQCRLLDNTATGNGGGADGGALNNCTLTGNSAANAGGGVNNGTLDNCALTGNSSGYAGGGVESSTLNNCTLTGNLALNGGGADSSTLNNCIVFYNIAPGTDNYSSSTLNYCCTTPLPANGANNITNEPQLTDAAHISAHSPCIGAGSANYSTGMDIDGEPWLNPPSIGCDEYYAGVPSGTLNVAILAGFTNVATGFMVNFTGLITGHAGSDGWNFGDGTVVSNQLSASHNWTSAGTYPVVLTVFNDDNPAGVSSTVFIHVLEQPVAYVSVNNPNPVPPYVTWDTAATNIQDAVDVVYAGGTVWVTNGVYQTGGRALDNSETNRVAVSKPLTVQSVNGPDTTVIDGDGAMRCVYLTDGAALAGFALNNGAIPGNGGGVLCVSSRVVVSNCVLAANSAGNSGGGAFGGTLINCAFTNNYGYSGGAAMSSSLDHCTLLNNLSYYGGGACNSTLTGCTLTGNFTYTDSDYTANGGGASGCLLTDCVITRNSSNNGGGASGCTLVNCVLSGNVSDGVYFGGGGGASGSTLVNCTVIGNTSVNAGGGGVLSCALTNSIVYFNTAPNGTNYSDDSSLYYCDTMPLPTNGANNITADPLLADLEHISAISPCRGAGTAAATTGVDIDGDAWLNPPSIGCDEFYSSSATGALAVAIAVTFTNITTGFTVDFAGQISGHATANRWDFGDGTIVSNQLTFSHSWSVPGNYTVTFTAFNPDHPVGVTASVTIFVLQNPVHYVSPGSPSPVPPYLSWATAATNIQDAIDAAYAGGTVVVSNGYYQTGVRVLYGSMTNRVAVTRPLTMRSVNGAAATFIDGGNVMRCLYLTNGDSITGFALQNGMEINGAGVYCQSADDVLNDCVLTNNSSPADWSSDGGAYGGILNRCVLAGNTASYLGGGAVNATLNFCVISNNARPAYGGGADSSTLNNCLVSSNAAAWGAGVENCAVNNSLLIGNVANYGGGAAIWSTLNNCTVVSNTVFSGPGTYGGAGVFDGSLNNCIVYYNNGPNCSADWSGISLNHCCTTPDPGGANDITNEPGFMNLTTGDFHLRSNSPCINSGNNAYAAVTNDLDGNARIVGGTVDIGAYEYQTPTSIISYAWLQQYGLPTDGSVDYADLDGTGMNAYQDWIAGLNPTNALSDLAMLPPAPTNNPAGLLVSWESVSNITYFLQSSTNLSTRPAFSTIQSNIVGQAGTTSYIDTTATNGGSYFYRVGVQ